MSHTGSLPPKGKRLRTIGFDDAPFLREGKRVNVSGIVCSGTRFEGMVWGEATKDGWDATEVIAELLCSSKYHAQVHAVLLDGVAVGGFNVIDLPALHRACGVPCIAVMRRLPNIPAMLAAMEHLPEPERRRALLAKAGPLHEHPPFVYQAMGTDPVSAAEVLERVTDKGHVPEPLRLAHLIGSAVIDGQSRGRA